MCARWQCAFIGVTRSVGPCCLPLIVGWLVLVGGPLKWLLHTLWGGSDPRSYQPIQHYNSLMGIYFLCSAISRRGMIWWWNLTSFTDPSPSPSPPTSDRHSTSNALLLFLFSNYSFAELNLCSRFAFAITLARMCCSRVNCTSAQHILLVFEDLSSEIWTLYSSSYYFLSFFAIVLLFPVNLAGKKRWLGEQERVEVSERSHLTECLMKCLY